MNARYGALLQFVQECVFGLLLRRRSMHVEDRHGVDELRILARKAKDGRMRSRLLALALAKRGHTAVRTAELLGMSRRIVQKWVQRYNENGLAGLSDRPGRGRACKLSADQQRQLQKRIEAGPREEDGVCTLRGADIQTILEREFGVLYHLNGVYALLHRLGYSSLMPRPRHQKTDPEVQAAFKKKSLAKSSVSARLTAVRRSRSGFRMKPGSGSKAH